MKKILFMIVLVISVTMYLPFDVYQVKGDILPRIRCQFSKSVYSYGDPVIFYLEVDLLPNTSLGEFYLEELRPNGAINTISFGVLDQGSYALNIGEATPPVGYRYCTLKSKKEVPGGFASIIRWQGGYSIEASAEQTYTPSPYPTPSGTIRTIEPQPDIFINKQSAIGGWLPAVLIIIAITTMMLVLYKSLGSDKK